jgi:outer membrane lipoprotein carrier protein
MKKNRQLVALCFIFAVLYSFCVAAPSTTYPTEWNDLFRTIQTIDADFVQTTYDEHGRPVQKSYGHMALKRPGQFRWEVVKPIPQLIIANQKRLWVYDPDLEQVTIRSLKSITHDAPALLLSHEGSVLEKDFVIKVVRQQALGERCFCLTARKADYLFAVIQFCFRQNQLHEIRLQDHLGHLTNIVFQQVRTNAALPAKWFVIKIPPHVDVIDETH